MPRDEKTGFLIPGRISKSLAVPNNIKKPEYVGKRSPAEWLGGHVRTDDEIRRIRTAAKIAAQALQVVGEHIRPGVSSDALDRIAHDFIVSNGGYPSTLGYRGYPKSICTSINEVICHGIPDDTILEEGDIVNIDITVFKDGFHGDTNATFPVGEIDTQVADLLARTQEALNRSIASVAPGRPVNVIGRTIESYAKRFNYGVVRDFTGHGIGEAFHSGLVIPHFDAAPNYSNSLEFGMVFTIEPMLTLGTHEWDMWSDGWTVTTKDKSMTAQFEHTLVVREDGAEILTLP